jgi:diaminohydroxyphosphoribosylaminopyrimidine deaminase/5-amino-6-(5-phosphoribosylamino)uracil reductase
VVVGVVDPNPLVARKGLQILRDGGIDTEVGVEESACRQINESFFKQFE